MKCFPELTYSIYADGELPAQEAREVEAHLLACPRCRALVEASQAEARFLMNALQSTPEGAIAVHPQSSEAIAHLRLAFGFLWTFLAIVGVVTAVTWLSRHFPSTADWLNPFNRTTLLNLFWSGVLYLSNKGDTMLHEIVTMFEILALGLLILGALLLLLRRRSASVALLLGLPLALLSVRPAYAFEKRTGKTVSVPSGETVNGALLANGETVDIEGVVNGDVFSFARRVVIRGTVKGDVISFNQTLDVAGRVEGNLYSFAQVLSVRGAVARSVYAWVQNLQLDSTGRVDADVMAGSAQVILNGTVGRDAMCGCGSLELRGSVGRDLTAHAGNVTLAAPARVGGDFIAYVHKKEHVQIDSGVTIAGKTEIKLHGPRPSRYTQARFYFWQGVQLAAALLAGLVLFWLFPVLFPKRIDTGRSALRAAGIGFLILVATPVAALMVGITLIGLPIALIGLAVWLVALYLAKVFVASLIGQRIIRPPVGQGRSFALDLLIGLFIIFVAINIPYVGGWISLLVILLGLGVAFSQVFSTWRRLRAAS